MYEVVGWSFTEPGLADRLRLAPDDPRRRFVVLENPMSEDHTVMRTTLLSSLLDAARHNVARGRQDLALFEAGNVYRDDGNCHEHRALAGCSPGAAPADVGDLRPRAGLRAKGVLSTALHAVAYLGGARRPGPSCTPGSARVLAGGGRGLDRRAAPARRARLGPRSRRAYRSTSTACWHAVAVPRYVDLTSFPAAHGPR
jgi:phenylalanyl-tRNA synthetase beta chain